MNTNIPADLASVAEAAVREFLGEPDSMTVLAHGQSLTYHVVAAGAKYLLRLHAPLVPAGSAKFLEPQVIESECAWLRALGDETHLVVQRPVASPSGRYVISFPRSGSGFGSGAGSDSGPGSGPRAGDLIPCTMLTWVEGELLDGRRTEEQAARLGELLANLQSHAENWAHPSDFERPVHGPSLWQRVLPHVDDLVSARVVQSEHRDLISQTVDQLDRELLPLIADPGRFGLIHGDLHESNYVFHNGSPRPIDFGRCGFGPWLYDLAECIGHLHPDRRRNLVDAYAEKRPLEDGDMRLLEGYFIAALVDWISNHAPDPAEHEFLLKVVPGYGRFMRDYLDGKEFLFVR